MIEQSNGSAENSKKENEDGSLQSAKEAEGPQDNYYEVDEKKLVITNIGDGTPHEEGLAGSDETDDENAD